MSLSSHETILSSTQQDVESDFIILVDAPYLTIVHTEGRFRARTWNNPLCYAVLLEVAGAHGLIVDELVDPGWGGLEITFRESGTQ